MAGLSFNIPHTQPLLIGRDPQICQVVFPDTVSAVSRKHCLLRYDAANGVSLLEDCGSANGTFLASGERLIQGRVYSLRPGDKFFLSGVNNTFHIGMG